MLCCNTQDGCTKEATRFIIGLDYEKRHYCETCFDLVATEINSRLKAEQWAEGAIVVLQLNASVGNPIWRN